MRTILLSATTLTVTVVDDGKVKKRGKAKGKALADIVKAVGRHGAS